MRMKFNMNVWLKLYNKAQSLHPVRDHKEIEEIKKRTCYYLDACGMFMPEPLWIFDPEDKSKEKPSWKWLPSHCTDPERAEDWTELNPNFAYEHLCT
jgi:hypothetical protein